MSTEATLGMGADVADLESFFDDEPANPANEVEVQNQLGADTHTGEEVEVVLDEEGNEVASVELDENGNPIELEVDPNADPDVATELVVPDDHKVKLNIDGKDVEFTFGDLKAGAQKYEAANKRFEEAAAIRKEYTDKSAGLGQREQQLAQVLGYYIQQSQQYMEKEPDWASMIQNDPQKYLVERHNWDLRQKQLGEARQVQANLNRLQAEQQQASNQQRVAEAVEAIRKAVPEWSDPKKAAEGAQVIDKYLAEQGIAPEMRAAIDSAEVLLVARKAMLYDQAVAAAKARKSAGGRGAAQAQAQQPQARAQQRQVVRQPQVERPGAGRSVAQQNASNSNLARANAAKRFNSNPSVDTLADFFE